jgi:hypothetical protein
MQKMVLFSHLMVQQPSVFRFHRNELADCRGGRIHPFML